MIYTENLDLSMQMLIYGGRLEDHNTIGNVGKGD